MPHIERGSIWWAGLDPTRGHEQGGDRPCLVLSIDNYNVGVAGLVVVAPLTRRVKPHLAGMHVRVNPPEGGLTAPGIILCDQVRTVDQVRLRRSIGRISSETLAEVEDKLRILLGL